MVYCILIRFECGFIYGVRGWVRLLCLLIAVFIVCYVFDVSCCLLPVYLFLLVVVCLYVFV